jgi:glutaminyl-tRNA synthetase
VLVEREDFAETPPAGWFRLAPGAEVRLRGAWIVKCTGVDKDASGRVVGLRGTYDPQSRGANAADGRKIKGTLHWVSATHAADLRVRIYEQLFVSPRPGDGADDLNPDSLRDIVAKAEPSLASLPAGSHVQLERLGYFFADPVDSAAGAPVLNRVVALKDSWTRAKAEEPVAKPAQVPPPKFEAKAPDRPARSAEEEDRYALYVKRGLDDADADLIARDPALADAFAEALKAHKNARGIANWLVNDLRAALKERTLESLPIGGAEIGGLVALIDANRISSRIAKDVFAVLLAEGGDPAAIVKKRGWEQVSDESAIAAAVDAVLAELPDKVAEYKAGRTGLLGLFTGQVMKRTGGKANPPLVKQILEAKLGA